MDVSENHAPPLTESPEAPMEARPPQELTSMGRLNERALEVVRAQPILCLVGALTVGFVVGKIAARY